jgi:hypothetical protein
MSFGMYDMKSIFNPPEEELSSYDFKVSSSDINGTWVKLEELQEMVENDIIKVDFGKLENYKNSWKVQKEQ